MSNRFAVDTVKDRIKSQITSSLLYTNMLTIFNFANYRRKAGPCTEIDDIQYLFFSVNIPNWIVWIHNDNAFHLVTLKETIEIHW